MQYVRSITGTVSKGWNSINPATLSGAIDVIVVEQEDGGCARPRPQASQLMRSRLPLVLPVPCAIREVPVVATVGEEGRLTRAPELDMPR